MNYKTVTRAGVAYYAEGPYAGKKVGTVRGRGYTSLKTDYNGWIEHIPQSSLIKIQKQIATKAKKLGFNVFEDESRVSFSKYLTIVAPQDTKAVDEINVRISDHYHKEYAKDINIVPGYKLHEQLALLDTKLSRLQEKYKVSPPKKTPKTYSYKDWEQDVLEEARKLKAASGKDVGLMEFWQEAEAIVGPRPNN